MGDEKDTSSIHSGLVILNWSVQNENEKHTVQDWESEFGDQNLDQVDLTLKYGYLARPLFRSQQLRPIILEEV